MRGPPLVPTGFDVDVYMVLDDFGQSGRVYREADEREADRETVLRDLIAGQYNNPVRIVCFNTAQGTSRDATTEIAQEIKDRSERKGDELSQGLRDFIERELERAKRMAL
jgi:hypothetical protein